ncbi:MAG: TIGR01459 family HAD-type hydrolase [Pseudomonadota bacterium]
MHSKPIRSISHHSEHYDVVLSDVWGVLHNGVTAWPSAVEALTAFRDAGKTVVLVSNAPRPNPPVREQLAQLGVPQTAYDDIVTSGDVTRTLFEETYRDASVTHIGPDKDKPLVHGLPVTFTDDASAQVCLCSGLMDDAVETPEDYRERLKALAKRDIPMVCANPDKVVELGDRLIYCSGALADLYEELGGTTIIVGKPHSSIYETALKAAGNPDPSRVLAIGDSLRTDVRGAADQGVDCLFLTGGIHATEFGPTTQPDWKRVAQFLEAAPYPVIGWMARLKW